MSHKIITVKASFPTTSGLAPHFTRPHREKHSIAKRGPCHIILRQPLSRIDLGSKPLKGKATSSAHPFCTRMARNDLQSWDAHEKIRQASHSGASGAHGFMA